MSTVGKPDIVVKWEKELAESKKGYLASLHSRVNRLYKRYLLHWSCDAYSDCAFAWKTGDIAKKGI
eukprot:756758-Hanusia_phi.AAC.8